MSKELDLYNSIESTKVRDNKIHEKWNGNILAFEQMNGLKNGKKITYPIYCSQMSNIWNQIIKYAGTESSFSSDILTQYNTLVDELSGKGISTYNYIFAIRDGGVDGIPFFKARINENPKDMLHSGYYHRILLLAIEKKQPFHASETDESWLALTLYDITNKR